MTKIEFKGMVVEGDPYRCSDEPDVMMGAVHVGEEDVVDRVMELDGPVRVTVNGEVIAEGVQATDFGGGYSAWTPMDNDVWKIGDTDLIELIQAYEGEEIELVVEEMEGGA